MRIVLADREADLMAVLWAHGASTVAEVRSRLKVRLAYNTVLSILRTLEAKGYVGHEQQGRAFRYLARLAPEDARRSALRHLAGKLFNGSVALLLTSAVADRKLTQAEIVRIRELLDERCGDKGPARKS